MKNKIILFLLACCILLPFSCKEDNDTLFLQLEEDQVHLDPDGNKQYIRVSTNAHTWQIYSDSEWISASRDSCFVVVSAPTNPSREERSGKVIVVGERQYARIQVSQEKSIRFVGELYPDEENPIGMIFSVSEGGKHGKIVSLDETIGPWGVSNQENLPCRDLYDGQTNTRYMIDTYKGEEHFDTDYYAFSWILHEKNGGDPEGEWYLPAFAEVTELYCILTGNTVRVNTGNTTTNLSYNLTVRENMDNTLKKAGGMPFEWDGRVYYWSSTEYNPSSARGEAFIPSYTPSNYISKTSERYIRAVRKF